MPKIITLEQETIDKIAAGEVVERPASVVKELVENSIDAGADSVSVEIEGGGIDSIRITDNGCGIPSDQIRIAFLRHTTSKIRNSNDLMQVRTLGFRGEALSSIAAVSKVELFTKTSDEVVGSHYRIEGAQELSLEQMGTPDGTTFLIKSLFYNTPARRKFLKSPMTEGNYIADLLEKLSLSHPNISFRLVVNRQEKFQTPGNGNLRDTIFSLYGRDLTTHLIEIDTAEKDMRLHGFLGESLANRGNRSMEIFFVNGRYIRSKLLSKALEEGYHGFVMQHQYPMCFLFLDFDGPSVDVNVHPTKQDVRFSDEFFVYQTVSESVHDVLTNREDIAEIRLSEHPASSEKPKKITGAEPFETNRLAEIKKKIEENIRKDSPYEEKYPEHNKFAEIRDKVKHIDQLTDLKTDQKTGQRSDQDLDLKTKQKINQNTDYQIDQKTDQNIGQRTVQGTVYNTDQKTDKNTDLNEKNAQNALHVNDAQSPYTDMSVPNQMTDFKQQSFLSEDSMKRHRIIGQVFDTYWIIEYGDKMYMIDQHAAHEKVNYERMMKLLREKQMTSQMISPPKIVTLTSEEQEALEKNMDVFKQVGFELESFGGKEYIIKAVPANLYSIDPVELFMSIISGYDEFSGDKTPEIIMERIASRACKASIKGKQAISAAEMDELFRELMTLDEPYHCPHGRPTMISFSRNELDKKFKRIVE